MVGAGAGASGRRWAWPLWPAFALLVVVILLVLLRACGLVLPGYGSWHRIGWAFCSPRASVSESERGQERGRALAEQALQLQLRIARKEMACLAAPPAPSPRRAERPRCPPIQPARLMLIFDTSGSMRLPLDADPADMEELERRWSEATSRPRGGRAPCRRRRAASGSTPPARPPSPWSASCRPASRPGWCRSKAAGSGPTCRRPPTRAR